MNVLILCESCCHIRCGNGCAYVGVGKWSCRMSIGAELWYFFGCYLCDSVLSWRSFVNFDFFW